MDIERELYDLIELARANPTYECEVRFGVLYESTTSKQKFSSVFDPQMFDSLLNAMYKLKWAKCTEYDKPQKFVTRYFAKDQIRWRQDATTHEIRRIQPIKDIHFDGTTSSSLVQSKKPLVHARISLKSEQAMLTYQANEPPSHVRLHNRWSFWYQSAHASEPSFRYDLSKVAAGADIQSAQNSTPFYEVEIELLRPFVTPNLVASFKRKIFDIMFQ